MELDNLRQVWREQAIVDQTTGGDQILSILQKKSQSPIAKMKRNLFWELVAVVVLYTAAISYYLFAQNGRFKEIGWMLFIFALVFVVYYFKKNKLLKEMECVTCEVRSNLERQVVTLEKYVKFYFIAGTVLGAVAYLAAGMIVYRKSGYDIFNNRIDLIIYLSIWVVVTTTLFFLNKWYVRKLYGQHVVRLKELLKQTEETA